MFGWIFVLCRCLLIVKGVFAADADGVVAVSANEGDSPILHTAVTLTHTSDLIQWEFGSNPRCSATFQLPQTPNIYDNRCNERFRDRLEFDHQTGSLTIRNIRTTDSGLYKLNVYKVQNTIKRTYNVSVTAVPASGRPLRWLVSVPFLILALTGIFWCRWRRKRPDNQAVPFEDKWNTFKSFWKNETKQTNQNQHQQV